MSSIIIFLMALIIIFWGAPFSPAEMLRKIFRPTYVLLAIFLLLLLLALDSDYQKIANDSQQISSDSNSETVEKSFSF